MKHIHAELIKAWADGQVEVEYRYPKDDGSLSLWKDLTQYVFHDWYEYRIKPAITQNNTQLHPVKELMNKEPVAWMDSLGNLTKQNLGDFIPLYTHPVKELTDEEIRKIALECDAYENDGGLITDDICIDKFARAILRKAQEK